MSFRFSDTLPFICPAAARPSSEVSIVLQLGPLAPVRVRSFSPVHLEAFGQDLKGKDHEVLLLSCSLRRRLEAPFLQDTLGSGFIISLIKT